jgi:hypothetical protein
MTEAEWLGCEDVTALLKCLGEKASARKLRLFGVACCRSVWHLLKHVRSRRAVETAERHADGLASDEELDDARSGAAAAFRAESRKVYASDTAAAARAAETVCCLPSSAADAASREVAELRADPVAQAKLRKAHVPLLRDIFGNPLRPPAFQLGWRSPLVVTLASGIYDGPRREDGTFADPRALAVLADALEDAGCNNAELLRHLRGSGPHIRGCWALDLILGKS